MRFSFLDSVSAEDEIRLKDANGRGPTKTHSSGEMNGSGSNGHAGPHESLPPRPDEKQNLLEVLPTVSTEVIAETLEVAAKTVSVVGEIEIDASIPADVDAIVEQDAAVRTVVFWVRQTKLMQRAHWQYCSFSSISHF